MENKKQDEKSLEDLLKAADDFRKWAIDFGNELSKVLADIQTSKKEEDAWEMKCPYKIGDNYWIICDSGEFEKVIWNDNNLDKEVFIAGNAFLTREAAELESKRRNLLTRFGAFRDECNDDWEADWTNGFEDKFFMSFNIFSDTLDVRRAGVVNGFYIFGYFKNEKDIKRAIELFGDEIKELFVECE
jgi:hypothetical protein